MVLPNPTFKTYRFSITRKQLKSVLIGSSVIAVLIIFFFFQYLYMAGEVMELKSLRKETRTQKIQIQVFSNMVEDLRKQMAKLKELDAKIRVIADINPSREFNQLPGQGGGEGLSGNPNAAAVKDGQSDALQKIHYDLSKLGKEALAQEVSFEELEAAMKDRRALWASTPSIWPVRGWLTSGFGKRISPFTGNLAMHNGLDIATQRDTPIVSPAVGVVSYEGFDSGLGKVLKVNHGYGIQTIYGHLSKVNATVGQRVKRGSIIGYVGNTGLSTGPHLHYEVFVNNVPVNPLRYILN
jgi:murein DD-endopeptidase MepM/ murein hydrolase activator NlpD